MKFRTLAVIAALSLPTVARAQDAAQFDFLLGHFELKVLPQARTLGERIHGMPKYTGSWRARRPAKGHGVEDELRVVDDAGNTRALTHFLRTYDSTAKVWSVAIVDSAGVATPAFRVVTKPGTIEMAAIAPGKDREGKAYVSRNRFIEVTSDAFKYLHERSYDGGRTWELIQRIEGKRTANAMHG